MIPPLTLVGSAFVAYITLRLSSDTGLYVDIGRYIMEFTGALYSDMGVYLA